MPRPPHLDFPDAVDHAAATRGRSSIGTTKTASAFNEHGHRGGTAKAVAVELDGQFAVASAIAINEH